MYYTFINLSRQALVFTCLHYKSFKNAESKGEIARNEQFLLFPQCVSIHLENFPPFSSNLKLSSANELFQFESLKFVVWDKVRNNNNIIGSYCCLLIFNKTANIVCKGIFFPR